MGGTHFTDGRVESCLGDCLVGQYRIVLPKALFLPVVSFGYTEFRL